jgi:hypothetical protein
MKTRAAAPQCLDLGTRAFYSEALRTLNESGVPFLVGGAYAFERYTGIARHTKDLDVFVRPADARRILDVLAGAGYHVELTYPHWLGKAFCSGDFVDVIFGAGNGVALVDDGWFDHAVDAVLFDQAVRLSPIEESIWSKAFIQERERYDGADVAHLLRAHGERLDWDRLLWRFGPHWRVLLSHLVLYGFIYPGERQAIPARVLRDLTARLCDEADGPDQGPQLCQGTLLSREQYLTDVDQWGYEDARLQPRGSLSAADIAHWTAAIDRGE